MLSLLAQTLCVFVGTDSCFGTVFSVYEYGIVSLLYGLNLDHLKGPKCVINNPETW